MKNQVINPAAPHPPQDNDLNANNPNYAAVREREIVPGIKSEVVDDGNVIYTTVEVVTETTIRKWAEQWRSLREQWPNDRIMYAVTEFPGFAGNLIELGLSQARAVVKDSKSIQGYGALVLPRNLAGQMVEYAVRAARFVSRSERLHVFNKREDAIRWLHTCRVIEEQKVRST